MFIPVTQPERTPAYTADDVRALLTSRPFGSLKTVSGAPFSIDDVRFVRWEEAGRVMRSSWPQDTAPSDVVCLVLLTGPFTGESISGPYTPNPRTWHPLHAILVFDAHNGRLYVEGFRD